MIHFTCDMCGKELLEGDRDHYVARIEIRAANDSFELTEEDLESDNLEKVSQLLKDSEANGQEPYDECIPVTMRIDLCTKCRGKILKDPFNAHAISNFDFSKN